VHVNFHAASLQLHLCLNSILCRKVLSCRLGLPEPNELSCAVQRNKVSSQEFRQGPMPRGKKELFNYSHSSLRNVIERSFGVLKMKWRILIDLPSYPMAKQSQIIMACMAVHNFIRESALADTDFDMCDQDENYVPMAEASSSSQGNRRRIRQGTKIEI